MWRHDAKRMAQGMSLVLQNMLRIYEPPANEIVSGMRKHRT